MMKKDLLNKQVVRAISLGLSAVMLTTPMTALAAEGDPVPTDDMDTTHDTDTQAAETAIQEAQDSTTDGGSIILEEAVALPSGDEVTVIPDADDAAGAEELKDVTATVDGETVGYTDVAEDETVANEALTDAEVDLIKADASEAAAEVDVTEANDIIEDIEGNNDIITDANQKAADAADDAVTAAEEAKAAVTEAEALEAVDKAVQAVADAEAAQAEAQAAYDENLIKLTDAEAELKAAEEKLAAANASLTASADDIAAAEEAVTAAEEKAAALKAEVDKEADTLSKSQDALLKAAYEKMMAIKSISNLYDGEGFDADGVNDEFVDTFGSESAGGGYWDAADDYFELYLKYVYGDNYQKGTWTRKNTLDNGLNYVALRDNVFTVIYLDENGEEATALYNYHTADTEGNISIYEKEIATGTRKVITQEEVIDYSTKLATETESGWVEYQATEGEIAVDVDDNKYVATGDAVVNNIILENNQTIDENSKTVGVPTLLDGQIVIETKANVETYKESKQTEMQYIVFKDIDWENLDLVSRHELARQAAAAKIVELSKNSNYRNIEAVFEEPSLWNGFCVGWAVSYDVVEVKEEVISTTFYATTKYENHDFIVGSHMQDKETQEEYKYWTERKNTTNDQKIKDAINGVETLLAEMKAKQDAAAIALLAAQEAKKDVEAAKAALENVAVDGKAYQAALERYNVASAAFDDAKAFLDTINDEVKEAQDAYEDAAAELGRFIPDPSTGGDDAGDDGDDDATPTTPVVVPVVTPEEIPTATVTPVAGGAGAGAGAGAAVVDIEDEETPLAAGIDNGNGDGDANGGDGEEVLVAGAEEDETAIVAIEDEETPLAAGSGADAKMSWWWLLIVALLGATGYKMYKEHQKKKEEAAQEA